MTFTNVDKSANIIANAFIDEKDGILFQEMNIRCVKCGMRLGVYYCENRLYAVRCKTCKTATLVYAARKLDAARKVGVYENA